MGISIRQTVCVCVCCLRLTPVLQVRVACCEIGLFGNFHLARAMCVCVWFEHDISFLTDPQHVLVPCCEIVRAANCFGFAAA